MNYELINAFCKKNNITLNDLATSIGVSRSGLYRSIRDQTMTVQNLEKIAQALGVPVLVFFDADNNTETRIRELENSLNRSGVVISTLKRQYMKMLMSYLGFEDELSHNEKELLGRPGVKSFISFVKGFTGNQHLYDEMEELVINISRLLGDKFDLSEGSGSPSGSEK